MTSRKKRLLMLAGSVLAGLASRSSFVPAVIYPYAGDCFYGMMICFLVGIVAESLSPQKIFGTALLICFLIEISQLNQSDFMIYLRSFKLGALILGRGFLWSDLVCYFFGTAIAAYCQAVFCSVSADCFEK